MEHATPVKPPWITAAKQWQRSTRPQGFPPAATPFTFGPWEELPAAAELQAVKCKLAPLEESNRWELVKKMVNPYEMVYTHEDPLFHPSIATIKPLSRSYFKLIEILHVMQFFEGLPKQMPKIRTAHVAEGPGGFIQAVIELAERHKRILDRATAMTLKPTDQRVPGWRRAAAFLHYHREVRLHHGADGTGNVYYPENQRSFSEAAAPGVHLFTADGGFDFSVNYSVQERSVFRLLSCSATVGLMSLAKGGSMVIKLFDMFSESTQILILLLGRCFGSWQLYKPAMSRPCNSERYFLGREFKGTPSPSFLDLLREIQRRCEHEEFPKGIATFATTEELTYLHSHIESNRQGQLDALMRADTYIAHPEVWYTDQLQRDFQTSLAWCHTFRVPTAIQRPIRTAPPEGLLQRLPEAGYTSQPVAVPQSSSPRDVSGCLLPSSPASPTLFVDCSGQTVAPPALSQRPSQTDTDSHEQTRVTGS